MKYFYALLGFLAVQLELFFYYFAKYIGEYSDQYNVTQSCSNIAPGGYCTDFDWMGAVSIICAFFVIKILILFLFYYLFYKRKRRVEAMFLLATFVLVGFIEPFFSFGSIFYDLEILILIPHSLLLLITILGITSVFTYYVPKLPIIKRHLHQFVLYTSAAWMISGALYLLRFVFVDIKNISLLITAVLNALIGILIHKKVTPKSSTEEISGKRSFLLLVLSSIGTILFFSGAITLFVR